MTAISGATVIRLKYHGIDDISVTCVTEGQEKNEPDHDYNASKPELPTYI